MVRVSSDTGLTDHTRKVIADIETSGFHVITIPEEGGLPGWAFSVGLYQSFRHPEVVVFGLTSDLLSFVVMEASEQVKQGKIIVPDQPYEGLFRGVSCAFKTVHPVWYRPFLGLAVWYYMNETFPTLQCFWPDAKKRYPWDDGFVQRPRTLQPKLWHTDYNEAGAKDLLVSLGVIEG